jgi:hypothetical protein
MTKIMSSLFGVLVLCMGMVNAGWGNDPWFGVFLMLCALAYFPPMEALATKWTGLSLPPWLKGLLGLFILWAAVGVGELADKVDMMRQSFGQ